MEKIALFLKNNIIASIAVSVSLLIPLAITSPYLMGVIILTVINIVMVFSVNVIQGYTGKVSLCQAAFYGMGAYTSSILTLKFGWSFWVSIFAAGVVPAAVAVIIGWPVLKLKGYYLAIATLGLQMIAAMIFLNWNDVTNGSFGIRGIRPPDSLLGLQFGSNISYYYLYLALTFLVIAFLLSLKKSRYGRAFLAIRADEIAAEASAINTTYYRILSFAISAFIAGIAGCMYAHYFRYISPYSFSLGKSIDVVAMLVIGGSGTIWGCITGALMYTIMPQVFQWAADFRLIIIGVCVVLVVIFMPEGVAGKLRLLWLKAGAKLAKKRGMRNDLTHNK
jgi:branched-chain amino acid transport system permease protein